MKKSLANIRNSGKMYLSTYVDVFMDNLFKALSDRSRLRILSLLAQGWFSVGEITGVMGMAQSLVSHHLKTLLDAGLIGSEKHGRMVFYSGLEPSLPVPAGEVLSLIFRWAGEQPDFKRDREAGAIAMSRRSEKSRSFFARHAAGWDCLAPCGMDLTSTRAFIEESLTGDKPAVVADLGTGTGRLISCLTGLAGRVIGIDSSAEMLALARQRETSGRVEFRLGELEHLPLSDGGVQAAVMHFVLHHCAKPEAIFPEVRRVLAPGGLFLLLDYLHHEEESYRQTMGDLWLGFELERIIGLARRSDFLPEQQAVLPTPNSRVQSFALRLRSH